MFLRVPSIAGLSIFLAAACPVLAVDVDGDGTCDVWSARYGARGLAQADDLDGDGLTNGEEAKAGTDPRDPKDTFIVDELDVGTGVDLEVPAQAGKNYRLFSAPAPIGPWSPVGLAVVANGRRVVFHDPATTTGKNSTASEWRMWIWTVMESPIGRSCNWDLTRRGATALPAGILREMESRPWSGRRRP
jgi:hypothetical protein